jgi:uroporphyrinogen decarboxylase
MTKRERIVATLARRPVDRPAVAFWRHVPDCDHDPKLLADAMLAFHRRFDLDLIKVMSSGVYCVEDWGCRVAYTGSPNGAKRCTEHAVRTPVDWERIRPLDPGLGAFGRELEAVRLIVRGRGDDAPVLHTVFSPLTIARKLAGDRLREDCRSAPAAVGQALDAIRETATRHALAALAAGADGLFFATQTATPETCTAEEYATWEAPWMARMLEALQSRSSFTLLHAHGSDIYFDAVAGLPAHALNWHDRRTKPSLAEAKARLGGAVVGGLAEWETLRRGPREAIGAEVRDAIRQTQGVGLIVAPGCVLPLDLPDAHLDVVVAAVRGA